jgi:hypothetical protein
MKILLTVLILTALACSAHAAIEWTWTNTGTGTEQGTFITDGALVGNLAPAGTYTVIDYSVTASAYGAPIGSVSSGEYFINQPDIGFDWDGSAPTVFWRSSGTYTNGTNLFVTTPSYGGVGFIGLDIGQFSVYDDDESTLFQEMLAPTLVPVGTVTADEGMTIGTVKTLFR